MTQVLVINNLDKFNKLYNFILNNFRQYIWYSSNNIWNLSIFLKHDKIRRKIFKIIKIL